MPKTRMRPTHIAITAAVTIACLTPTASAAAPDVLPQHVQQTEQVLKDVSWESGQAFVLSVNKTVAAFDDYVFDSKLTAGKGGEETHNSGRLYFKRDNRVRIESSGGTINNGAVVVRNREGTIRGAGGGMLRFMKMNLAENSRMLQLPNGYNAIKSDFSSLTGDVCRKLAQNAAVSRVSSSSVTGQKWDVPVKIIEVKDANTGERSDLIYVNAKTAVPVEWDVYRAGKLISVCTFGNFKANSGLADGLFEM